MKTLDQPDIDDQLMQITVGCYVTFKSPTRDGCRKATRKVTGFDSVGRALVAYRGYRDFVVKDSEIISVSDPV
jgi:hypothetical protein